MNIYVTIGRMLGIDPKETDRIDKMLSEFGLEPFKKSVPFQGKEILSDQEIDELLDSADEFIKTKGEDMKNQKTLSNTDSNGATKNVKDIVFWGDGDTFKLISKASSENEGWMKSTKAMQAGRSVVVQVTTQQRNPGGSYSVAEALTTVPESKIAEKWVDDGENNETVCIQRIIVDYNTPLDNMENGWQFIV